MTRRTYEITVRKTVAATPERIWETWTDPERYGAVHGSHETEIDFREGGTIAVTFWPDRPGGETFVILEIDEPRRLRFAWQEHEAFPVTLVLVPREDGTEVAITQECRDELGWIVNGLDGWTWIVDSLERYVETGTGIANDEWTREHGTHRIVKTEPS